MTHIDILDFDVWMNSTSADYSRLLRRPSLPVKETSWRKQQLPEESDGSLKVCTTGVMAFSKVFLGFRLLSSLIPKSEIDNVWSVWQNNNWKVV